DITTATGVIFRAIDEPGVVTISHAGLTEANLDGVVIDITLAEVQFIDATLDPANFTLDNAPTGTLVESVSYTNSVTATVTIIYDGSDFDTHITNFSITINTDELSGGVALTSNTLTITATVENESVAISHDGLNGDNLNGAEIAIELTNVSFTDTILDKENFTLNNVPSGTSVDTVVYTDVTHANLTLAYDGTVFNDTIFDFNITISSIELSGLDDLTSNNLVISPVTGIGPYPVAIEINIYSYEDRIFIKCSDPEKLREVAVYNILGRQLIRRKLDKSPLNEIVVTEPSSYYVVRVFTDEGITIQKVFISGR
ncbi:MAG: hypothetical protein KAX05_11400, partial [Bacteroidales bacterium]|nr:hypothetical protein [Bacteroidales bacterium]